MRFSLFVSILVLSAATQFTLDPGAYQRAVEHYRALAGGHIQMGDLNAQDRADVLELDRRLRNGEADLRTAYERCVDSQVTHHGGSPSALDWEVIALACGDQ